MRIELNLPVKDKPITQEWEEDEQFVKVLVPKYMIDETIEFLEKQIPKEPIKVSKGGEEYSGCPRCGKFVFGDYCSECGQALKWGGAE